MKGDKEKEVNKNKKRKICRGRARGRGLERKEAGREGESARKD